ncbi:MAG: DUF2953 domain-containing protein [Clostridia bacterium]|nr:DUF2953 domain-containing protein [Clostridia bacterium]
MWWLLLLIIPAIIMLILFIKVRLCLIYEDDLQVSVKVLLFNVPLYPQKEKKPKPSDYSLKKLQKQQNKLSQKSKQKKKPADTKKENDKATKIKDAIGLIRIILENVMQPFGRYLKIEIVKIHVKIASEDAAKTAFLYGIASQSIAYIIELLSNITNVDVKKKNSINVIPDFLDTTPEAKINITLGLRGWHAFVLAVKFFMGYSKSKNNMNENINSLKIQEEK